MTNDDIRELALDLADVFALHFSKPKEECRRVALTVFKQRCAFDQPERLPPDVRQAIDDAHRLFGKRPANGRQTPMEVERIWGPPTDEDD